MSAYGVAPLGRCDWEQVLAGSGQADGWCWAGHDGLVASVDGPESIVPTGWLWGWGESRWLRWRVDPVAGCVGAELRLGNLLPQHEDAFLRPLPAESTISLRTESHMLQWDRHPAPVESEVLALCVLKPAPMTFLAMRWKA